MAEVANQYGYTQQGQGVESLIDTLTGTANVMKSNAGTYENTQAQRLTQESGIPQLQNSQVDLGKLFQMYLADGNLAQKYAAPSQQAPVPTGQDYLNMQGDPSAYARPEFNGFTTPSLNTQAMGSNVDSVQNAIDILTNALSGQRTNVKDYTLAASKNYLGTIEGLLGMAKDLREQQRWEAEMALKKSGGKRDRGFNKNGDLVDLQTGEVIKSYGEGENSEYLDDKKKIISEISDKLIKNTNYRTVGIGGLTAGLPMSPAKDYASDLNTLRSNLSLSELTRLRMSGGGVGQVSNYEQMLLQNSISGISDQNISPEKMKENLQYIKDYAEGKNLKKYTGVDSVGGSVNTSGKTSGRFVIEKVE